MEDIFIETERLIISNVTKSSYKNVTKLYADSKNNAYATGVFGETAEIEVEIMAKLGARIKTGLNLTAKLKDKGSFIGYLSAGLTSKPRHAWIYALIIVPERRGEGYGTEFISAVESYLVQAYGVTFVGLSVADENVSANIFWAACGYSIKKTVLKSVVAAKGLSKINIYVKLL